MSSRFDECFHYLLALEGGYSTDRNDSGNYTPDGKFKGTKFGISAKSYPELDIEKLTESEAKAIYFRDYWHPSVGKTYSLPGEDWCLFDQAVHLGVRRALLNFQGAVKVQQDGSIGPVTLKASEQLGSIELITNLTTERLLYHQSRNTRYLTAFTKRTMKVLNQSIHEAVNYEQNRRV